MFARIAQTNDKSGVWMAALRDLIHPADTEKYEPLGDFDTVDALLAACAGDLVAGIMLKRVLAWYESKDGDEFYMSESGWKKQCYVSRHVIKRVQQKNFPRCGVSYTVKPVVKGNEAVTHYRLNIHRFIKRLSEVLEVSIFKLMRRLPVKRRYVLPQSDVTLTIDTPIKTKEEVVNVLSSPSVNSEKETETGLIAKMVAIGLSKKQALKFETLGTEVIEACIASTKQAEPRNPGGYLYRALASYRKPAQTNHDGVKRYDLPEVVERKPAVVDVVNPALETVVRDGWTAARAWSAAYQQMELQIAPDIFGMNLKGAKLVNYCDGEFVVEVANEYAQELLQNRYYRNVQVVVAGIVGDVAVRFVAPERRTLSELLQIKG